MTNKNNSIEIDRDTLARAVSAEIILEKSGIGLVDAARLVAELCESSRAKNLKTLRKIIELGHVAFVRERQSVSFENAVRIFLDAKTHLRERTQGDYRKILRRICRFSPEIRGKNLNTISADFFAHLLDTAFPTARQRCKARAILHALFAYCSRRKLCCANPISAIDVPRVKEREIVPLNLGEIDGVFRAAKELALQECIPAIALMLFAGIRPREVERLSWGNIDFSEKIISVSPIHSKTGGCRHVSIPSCLEKILERNAPAVPEGGGSVCPRNWTRKWRKIRRAAGWSFRENPWQQDVLRHTFASYHLKFFKNIQLLQCEMGHSSAKLLLSRYLSMRGITRTAAENFWQTHTKTFPSRFPRVA